MTTSDYKHAWVVRLSWHSLYPQKTMILSPFLFLGLVAGGTVNFSDSLKSKKSIDNYNLFDTFLMAHVIMDKI